MKTLIEKTSKLVIVAIALAAISIAGCSNKSDSDTANDNQSESAAENNLPIIKDSPVAPPAQPEMALVIQNFGMAKFSEFKRFYDVGYALFSIHSNGAVTSGTSSGLENFEIDWNYAAVGNYGEQNIALRLPPIKRKDGGQTLLPQPLTIVRTVEDKQELITSEAFPEIFTIETLVLDSARTICLMGVSTP